MASQSAVSKNIQGIKGVKIVNHKIINFTIPNDLSAEWMCHWSEEFVMALLYLMILMLWWVTLLMFVLLGWVEFFGVYNVGFVLLRWFKARLLLYLSLTHYCSLISLSLWLVHAMKITVYIVTWSHVLLIFSSNYIFGWKYEGSLNGLGQVPL
jgi:hypothetical protein